MADAQSTSRERPSANFRNLLILIAALGVLAIVALFVYITRPGPCDSILEQTAPKLEASLHFLKTNGEMVIGNDQLHDLAESAQRIAVLCKTCCIAQQSGRISAAQFQDCVNTTKSYETEVQRVAISVDAANTAKQKGQTEVVSQKTQEATLAAKAAAGEVQKLDNNVTALSNNPAPAPDASAASSIPPRAVVITRNDGTKLWVSENTLSLAGSSVVGLESGQSVNYPKIKTIDFLGIKGGKATVRLTLVDGRTMDGTLTYYLPVWGSNELGNVSVPIDQVKRIDFPR